MARNQGQRNLDQRMNLKTKFKNTKFRNTVKISSFLALYNTNTAVAPGLQKQKVRKKKQKHQILA